MNPNAASGAREICDVIAKFPAAAEKCYTFFLAPYEIKYEEQNIKKVLEKDCTDIYQYLGPNSRIIKIMDQYAKN